MLRPLLSFIAPYDCVRCGIEGSIICASCLQALPTVPERCFYCFKLTKMGKLCSACQKRTHINSIKSVAKYDSAMQDVIAFYKFRQGRDIAKHMAVTIANNVESVPQDVVVTWVPTVPSHVRERGFDHAKTLAKYVAYQLNVPYAPMLRRLTNARQLGASRISRRRNMKDAFCALEAAKCYRHIILVDDVITTGATVEAAADALRNKGVRPITVLSIAQATL